MQDGRFSLPGSTITGARKKDIMKTAGNRLGTALAAAALLALTACSNGGASTPQADRTPSTSAASDSTPLPDASATPSDGTPEIESDLETGQIDHCKDQTTHFTGEAAQEFGAKKVMAAYCHMVTLAMTQSFVPSMMRKHDGFRAIEFSAPRDLMTPVAAADWDEDVARIVNGETDDYSNSVLSLMMYNVTFGDHYDFYPASEQQPVFINQQFTPADTWIDDGGNGGPARLGMEFIIKGNLFVTKDNKPYVSPMEKTYKFALVENGTHPDKPWLIDGWEGAMKFGQFSAWHPETVDDNGETTESS